MTKKEILDNPSRRWKHTSQTTTILRNGKLMFRLGKNGAQ